MIRNSIIALFYNFNVVGMSCINNALDYLNNPSYIACQIYSSLFNATLSLHCLSGYCSLTLFFFSILNPVFITAHYFLEENRYKKISNIVLNVYVVSISATFIFLILTFLVACYNISLTAVFPLIGILFGVFVFFNLERSDTKVGNRSLFAWLVILLWVFAAISFLFKKLFLI